MRFPLVMFIVGCTFIGIYIFGIIQARQRRNWPTVEGKISSTSEFTGRNKSGSDTHFLRINYSYEVGEKRFHAKEVRGYYTEGIALHYKSLFSDGASVEVHYSPAHPTKSTLDPNSFGNEWGLLLIGISFLLLFWWIRGARKEREALEKAEMAVETESGNCDI